jgi:ribosomal protein S17E
MRRGRKSYSLHRNLISSKSPKDISTKIRRKFRETMLTEWGKDTENSINVSNNINDIIVQGKQTFQVEEDVDTNIREEVFKKIKQLYPEDLQISDAWSEPETFSNCSVNMFIFPPSYYPTTKRIEGEKTLHNLVPVSTEAGFSFSLKKFSNIVNALFDSNKVDWITTVRVISNCRYHNIKPEDLFTKEIDSIVNESVNDDTDLYLLLEKLSDIKVVFRIILDMYLFDFFTKFLLNKRIYEKITEDTFKQIEILIATQMLNLIGMFSFEDLKIIISASVVSYILNLLPSEYDETIYNWQLAKDYYQGLLAFHEKVTKSDVENDNKVEDLVESENEDKENDNETN